MKKQLLTLIAVAISAITFAQKTDTVIFNGASKLIIKNNLSAEENYKKAGQIMLDQNYTIGSKDKEFFQISTEPEKVTGEGISHMLSIYAICKDNQVTIIGKSKNTSRVNIVTGGEVERSQEVVPYKKLRALSKNIYYRLTTFAKAFKGNELIYSE